MPWKPADADKHKKGLSPKAKELWARTANSALQRCGGGPDCEAKAIKAANAVAGRMKEATVEEQDYWLDEAEFSADQRKKLAAQGKALPEGGFPIRNRTDLGKAIRSIGRAENPPAAKRHIIKRARALGLVSMLPEDWGIKESEEFLPYETKAFKEALGRAFVESPDFAGDLVLAVAELAEAEEEVELQEPYIELVERAVRPDGTLPLKIIKPGWGSSAYYKPEVLERDGPKAFPAGTKMYWDHPTKSEEKERPERSLRDLAAELVTPATFRSDGKRGPGLYADAKVFGHYKDTIDELAPHIGVSIRAQGIGEEGEMEGRRGPVLEELSHGRSVDFVTEPGAGGKILEVFEAARPKEAPAVRAGTATISTSDQTNSTTISVSAPTKEAAVGEQELQEAQKQVASLTEAKEAAEKERDEARTAASRAQEALAIRDAKELISEAFGKLEKDAKISLPDATQKRLMESLSKNPPITDEGTLDREKFMEAVTEAVKGEAAYLAEVAGSGKVRGMGPGSPGGDPENAAEGLEESFRELGLSESGAKVAAKGR